jgi:hypothetical protein
MPEQVIICPNCKTTIPLTEAIAQQIKGELRKELDSEVKKKEKEFIKKEQVLADKIKQLEDIQENIEQDFSQKLKLEKEKTEKEANLKAKEANALEIKDLTQQIHEKDKKLQEAQQAELELRKERRKLEENKKAFELEMTRKIDGEREKIKEATLKTVMESHRLKDLEKEKQITGLRTQIDELKRKAEQGSQQTQGEVLEIELEDILKSNFPRDSIEPVSKGIKGADILQKVHTSSGLCCGMIIWETKRTKAWSDSWIAKLKDDQREIKAEIAVIMTTSLPKDIKCFSYINGVWVTDYTSIIGLATALRLNLIQLATAKLAANGKHEKMEVIYNYLTGQEFRQRVEAIFEAFVAMKNDLDQEKRAMTRIWAKREKQIERIANNTIGMYGDMQGIIGASLLQMKGLQLNAATGKIDYLAIEEGSNESDVFI